MIKLRILSMALIVLLCFSSCNTGNNDSSGTETDISTQESAVAPEDLLGPDYSDHDYPNEENYRTVLAVPEQVRSGKPVIAMTELKADWSWRREFTGFEYDPNYGYDLREKDMGTVDLSGIDFRDFAFSTGTLWPETLPEGFSPEAVLEEGKNPGLGIRALHDQGITGEGVGIAILDQALLLEHQEYADRLMYYERVHCYAGNAQMHGPAVASIAVGKTTGVAPKSKLYYIAESHGHSTEDDYFFDASIIADSIGRIIQVNRNLPEGEKIRVISISRGYTTEDTGYEELQAAIAKADAEGMFVITTATYAFYPFDLFGLGRSYMNDPDKVESYGPAWWIEDDFFDGNVDSVENRLYVPMGSRTYAACYDEAGYEIARPGGLSWAVPWCAGFYALCCQVKPDITPEEFIRVALETSVSAQIERDGQSRELSGIINPQAVIEALRVA